MDIAHLLSSFESGLRPFVAESNGQISVAADPEHVCELLANSPAGWRLILSFAGSKAVDPNFSPGINQVDFNATVQAARGLHVNFGADSYLPNSAGRDPLLTLAERVSCWLRGLHGDHVDIHDKGVRELSRDWLVVDGLNTRQLNMLFSLKIAANKPIPVPVTF